MSPNPTRRAWWRLLQHPRRRQWLALEAAGDLLALKAILVFIPFKHWRGLLRAPKGSPPGDSTDAQVAEIVWAVDRVSSRFPKQLLCLPRALAVRAMLERRRIPCQLRIGVSRDNDGRFAAHAWLEYQGQIVIGDLPDLARFAPLPEVHAKPIANP